MKIDLTMVEVPRKPRVVYCIFDEAFSREESDFKAYMETLDPQHLVFIGEPVTFHVSPLSVAEMDDCEAIYLSRIARAANDLTDDDMQKANSARQVAQFNAGCRRIDGVTMATDDGEKTGELPRRHWGKLPSSWRRNIGELIATLSAGRGSDAPFA